MTASSAAPPIVHPPTLRALHATPESARDRLLRRGCGALRDEEVLALALGAGPSESPVETVAREIIAAAGGLRQLLALTQAELSDLAGVGSARATRLLACAEIGRRAMGETLTRGRLFRSSRDVFRHYAPLFRDLHVEQFRALLLDGKHRVLREELVSQGTLTSSPVHPREVFGPAMRHAAAAMVLVHNHPSGDPTPSADDLDVTRRLRDVGQLVGIQILDHVIIGDGTFASLADRGLL